MPSSTAEQTQGSATLNFTVDGLKCRGCSSSVERVVESCPGFLSATCDHITKRLVVTHTSTLTAPELQKDIIQKVTDAGFECSAFEQKPPVKKDLTSRWVKGFLGLGSGAVLMALMLLGVSISMPVMAVLAALSTVATVALGAEFYSNAWTVFNRSRELNMNTLFAISTLTVLTVSIASFFVPGLPMLFDAGLMIFGFRHIGIAIESSIKQSVVSNIRFQDYAPNTVRLVKENATTVSLLKDVSIGDYIEIRAGEVIPLDGECETDACMIYDTIETGSRIPRPSSIREPLLAGMFLAADAKPLIMKVTKRPEDSYLARFDEQIHVANQKQALQTTAKTILQYFIPGVLLLSLTSLAVMSIFFTPALAIQSAIAVLVSACPCTLGMILPLALKIGMTKSLNHGVQFKSSKAIEEVGEMAGKVNEVVFDLHGTLTEGKPSVECLKPIEGVEHLNQVMAVIYALEKHSSHPVAKSICTYVTSKIPEENQLKPLDLKRVDTSNPAGVIAFTDDGSYAIGSRKLMMQRGIELPAAETNLAVGCSRVYVAKGNRCIATLIMKDSLRNDAKDVVHALFKQGKNVSICTGADEVTANAYAKELEIKDVYAGASNDKTKLSHIQSLKKKGAYIAMIGDGPNDAPALAAADIGIAVKTGDDVGHAVSQEQAAAVIEDGSLKPVLAALEVSQQTVANIKQNLLLSFAYNLTTMGLAGGVLAAFGFAINPAFGAGFMILQSSMVMMNAYRFKQQNVESVSQLKNLERGSTCSYTGMSPVFGTGRSLDSKPEEREIFTGPTIQLFSQHKPPSSEDNTASFNYKK
jgi:P-type Cu2+ transporter